jgi:hypothetical protein
MLESRETISNLSQTAASTKSTKNSMKPQRLSLMSAMNFKSFTKSGLNISQSSATTISCDSSTCSFDESFVPGGILGCMKGSQDDLAKSRKRRVRFNSTPRSPHTAYTIKPLFAYTDELWWTKDDLDRLKNQQSNFSESSMDTKTAAMKYLSAYSKARSQVFRDEKHDKQEKPMMTANVYEELVMGRSKGFGALELYSDESGSRRERVRNINLLTLAAFYDFRQAAGLTNVDKMLRSYSRSLTTADRYWAVAVGNADREALVSDTNE